MNFVEELRSKLKGQMTVVGDEIPIHAQAALLVNLVKRFPDRVERLATI